MRNQYPTTETMKISDVRGQLNTLVNRVYRKETRVVVEKSGIPVAGLVSAEDLRRLDQLDRAERDSEFAVLDQLRSAFADVPVDELERETDRIAAQIRAERGPVAVHDVAALTPLPPQEGPEMVAMDGTSGRQQSPGVPSTQSPQEFYAVLTSDPKVRRILTELAK